MAPIDQSLVVAAITAVVIAAAVLFVRRKYSFWSRRGIPGPEPMPILGNSLPMMTGSIAEIDIANIKKYGKVYGIYEGFEPVLMIADPDIINDVFATHYHLFSDNVRTSTTDEIESRNVFVAGGEEWKKHRSVVNRSLTSAKVKDVSRLIDNYLLINRLKKDSENGQMVEIGKVMQLHAVDMAYKIIVGIDLDLWNDPDVEDKLSKTVNVFLTRIAFTLSYRENWIVNRIPFWCSRLLGIIGHIEEAGLFYRSVIEKAILQHQTQSGTNSQSDFLSNLLDAESRGLMTRDDVISNAILVNGASWGAVSHTLSFLMYEMAKNPGTQETVVQEIIEVMKKKEANEELNDLLPEFVYLEAALNETLRLHPVETRIYRRVSAKQGALLPGTDNVMLPHGLSIQVPLYALSHDPDLWPSPDSFDPDRFLPHNKAYHKNCSFMAFSAGGRHCPGYKLSHNQMKRTMIDIMREFEVTKYAPDHHVFPKNSYINIPMIQVAVVMREHPLF